MQLQLSEAETRCVGQSLRLSEKSLKPNFLLIGAASDPRTHMISVEAG